MSLKEKIYTHRRLIAAYAVCVLLLVFYVAVLFSPRDVCFEYELYYVSGELTEWPKYGGLKYSLGEKICFGSGEVPLSSRRLGTGFGGRENGYSWTEGECANVLFDFEYDGDMTAVISIGDMLCDSYDIQVNGQALVESCTLSDGELRVDIPNMLINKDEVTYFSFIIHSPRQGSETDRRMLGIQVREMTVEERK